MKGTLTIGDKIILFPIWALSLLPLRVLYLIADLLFILIFYLVRYRRGVVFTNLKNSFPEKSDKELHEIERKFFHYLCDLLIESIYLLNMSDAECQRRYTTKNRELIDRLYAEGRCLAAANGHFGNWEWASIFALIYDYSIYGIYKPLSNKRMDRFVYHLRSKHGSTPVPMKQTLRTITEAIKNKEIFAVYFVADQRPMKDEINYWTDFMNQKTPVISGMDKIARKYDLPVIFVNVLRTRRGYYEVSYDMIEANPRDTLPNEITDKYMKHLEALIRKQPELYLWSHKRWKFSYDEYINKEENA
ncbi:MAG: lysophospholipid acyltransferase family protein [Bacteroidales bacterium]|nr:lysophospholipid acyltransferase family protein [Bacteroidales bacterium]